MKVLLDTNVWSEIGRRDSRVKLEKLATSRSWEIQTPPCLLLEVVRTSDSIARHKIVEVLCSPYWKRLASEAELESLEFVHEARRLRPHWIKQVPTPGDAYSHHTFWTKTIWREARRDPDVVNRTSAEVHEPTDQHVARVAKENRQYVASQAPKLRDVDRWIQVGADGVYIEHSNAKENSRRVEAWRFKSREVFWHSLKTYTTKRLAGSGDTYVDWLEPELKIGEVGRDFFDFSTFWFDDVDPVLVPRLWLRGNVEQAQLLEKVAPSVGRDEQLSSHLPDCDIFVSNDRRLLTVLEIVAKACPFSLPQLIYFPKLELGQSAIEQLSELFH